MTNTYNYQSLIQAYVNIHRTDFRHPEFTDYYRRLLTALEQGFGISLNGDGLSDAKRSYWGNFQVAIQSCAHANEDFAALSNDISFNPYLIKSFGKEDNTLAHVNELQAHIEQSLPLHQALLDSLFVFIYGKIDKIITSEHLLQLGFDDTLAYQLDFLKSWDQIEQFFRGYIERNPSQWEFLRAIFPLITAIRENGRDKALRAGQSHSYFMISRSRNHRLEKGQAYIGCDLLESGGMDVHFYSSEESSTLHSNSVTLTPEIEMLLDKLIAEPIT